ncbi:hypothetical protein QJS10_CPB12g00279 [Acorus calamus]|uniref:DUF1421 domain-containing protein n=1 Tax=Acorus calamus TaxID=4465 RepID=A0AAV9DSF1_ACOCL|nr:hypothetical protein QJS10_CPB12g00279 [Acorus calamus]
MKKHADNMLHALEGVSVRLTQLESRTHHLECFVDDFKLSVANDHRSTDGKLRQLENILREMCPPHSFICRYKHAYKFYASSRRSPKLNCNLQRCKSPRKTNHNQKSRNPPLNTIQSLHSTNLSPRLKPLSHNLHHSPLPIPPSPLPMLLLQPLRSKTYLLNGTHIIHRLISKSQIPPTNNTKSPLINNSHHHHHLHLIPTPTDPTILSASPAAATASATTTSTESKPLFRRNRPSLHAAPSKHLASITAILWAIRAPNKQAKPGTSNDAILLALPMPDSIGLGSGSGNRVPIDDVVEKVATMGFSRDQVQGTVRKLTENGQSVDLNVVLDKLLNDEGSS